MVNLEKYITAGGSLLDKNPTWVWVDGIFFSETKDMVDVDDAFIVYEDGDMVVFETEGEMLYYLKRRNKERMKEWNKTKKSSIVTSEDKYEHTD